MLCNAAMALACVKLAGQLSSARDDELPRPMATGTVRITTPVSRMPVVGSRLQLARAMSVKATTNHRIAPKAPGGGGGQVPKQPEVLL